MYAHGKLKHLKNIGFVLLFASLGGVISIAIVLSPGNFHLLSQDAIGIKSQVFFSEVKTKSNLMTPVKVVEVNSSRASVWKPINPALTYRALSPFFPVDYNVKFPTNIEIGNAPSYAIPISIPLRVRNCANKLGLKEGLFRIEKNGSNLTFIRLPLKHRVALTRINIDGPCVIQKQRFLIQTTNHIFSLSKVNIPVMSGPIHFTVQGKNLIFVSRFGQLVLKDEFNLAKKRVTVFSKTLFSNTQYYNLGVKSILLKDKKLFVAAAIANSRCAHIVVRKIDLISFNKSDIYRSECYKNITILNEAFWTDMNGSGGRLANSPTGKTEILLSVGQAEIWQGSEPVKANPNLGVLIKIDLVTGTTETLSSGHRNMQGICSVNRAILTSEQGPQGGDELNWIKTGGDYGWPYESFGRPYGVGVNYPEERSFGQHSNPLYIKPIWAWLPSVAIGDLSCPKHVGDHSEFEIYAATLKDQAIHIIGFSDGKVIYDERVLIGERLRDIHFNFNTKKGYVITDSGNLYELKVGSF